MGLLGKKKLKKIPYDVVSYVLIEAEAKIGRAHV